MYAFDKRRRVSNYKWLQHATEIERRTPIIYRTIYIVHCSHTGNNGRTNGDGTEQVSAIIIRFVTNRRDTHLYLTWQDAHRVRRRRRSHAVES